MKTKWIGLLLVLFVIGLGLSFADDAAMGTWKLNESKSKFGPNSTKNSKVVYEAAGDSVKVTVDGTDPSGGAMHNEWTGKFDGKDYPVTGEPNYDTRSYKKVNATTLSMTLKKGGKVVGTGKIVLSADGKSRTVTTNVTMPDGKKATTTAVYDKE